MSDDGYDGGGVGDDYDYGGGYVSLVTRSSWFLYSPPNHEVIKRRHSYVIRRFVIGIMKLYITL